MNSRDIAIKVENISKVYRIGSKEELHDSFGGALVDLIKSPLKNYRKYRSLYKFDDIKPGCNDNPTSNPSDIIWALNNVSFQQKKGEVLGIREIHSPENSFQNYRPNKWPCRNPRENFQPFGSRYRLP